MGGVFLNANIPDTIFYVPDGLSKQQAIKRATHMAIAAHQDDLEIMAYDGILKCYDRKDQWFFGVVVTNGLGATRSKTQQNHSNNQYIEIRNEEQKQAAELGHYGALAMLNLSSNQVKDPNETVVIEHIKTLIQSATPQIIYTHNLADKHDTHVAVACRVIQAIRGLPSLKRPRHVYGCEVWRGLDWMMDNQKIKFDVSGQSELASNLIKVFSSQISGGKRYDLATMGRRFANATFSEPYTVDQSDAIIYAMDLTPLIEDDTLDITSYVLEYIQRFNNDVKSRIEKMIK